MPTQSRTKSSTSRPRPLERSPRAARLTSFSKLHHRAELLADRLDDAARSPAGQVGRLVEQPRRRHEHAGAADRGRRHGAPGDAGVGGHAVGDLAGLGDERPRAAGSRPLVAAHDDAAGDVGDGGPHPAAADVDADHPAGAGVELVELGARALAAARLAGLAGEPGGDEALEGEGDGRLGQAAAAGDVGARHAAAAAQQLEDGALVDGAQQPWLPRGEGRVEACRVAGRPEPPLRQLSDNS